MEEGPPNGKSVELELPLAAVARFIAMALDFIFPAFFVFLNRPETAPTRNPSPYGSLKSLSEKSSSEGRNSS